MKPEKKNLDLKSLFEKKERKTWKEKAVHTIWTENRLKIHVNVLSTVNLNMNHIRYIFQIY